MLGRGVIERRCLGSAWVCAHSMTLAAECTVGMNASEEIEMCATGEDAVSSVGCTCACDVTSLYNRGGPAIAGRRSRLDYSMLSF